MTKINLKVSWNEDFYETEVESNEGVFWKEVAQNLLKLKENIPNTLEVESDFGDASFYIGKRGSYIEKGIRYPSMYVTVNYNNITGLTHSDYEDAYLTCIHPESNNYKFYHLRPNSMNIEATYGRIGSNRGEAFGTKDLQNPYDHYLYWIRYYEKLSKGYVDQSDIYLHSKPLKAETHPSSCGKKDSKHKKSNKASLQLYRQLKAYAKHIVETALVDSNVTAAQVKAAKAYLREMGRRKTVKGFNNQLMKLLQVSPRKERYINTLLAVSEKDFAGIIEREEDLIAAMEAVAGNGPVPVRLKDPFESMGIEVYIATEKQKEQVLSHLSDSLKGKVKTIYRVINKRHKVRFDKYLKNNNIWKVKQLWHGSKNCNWFSIIENGLQLNPNAQITGKMFGQGIYFAPSSEKSWNYTSYHGTYWANGNEDVGFMGLYTTAYGHPHDVFSAGGFTQRQLKELGKDCVHAHAGSALRNDEIIFYSEAAMVLNYIVEFQ